MKTFIFIHGGESFTNHEEYLDWIRTTAVEWTMKPFEIQEEKKRWKLEIAKQATKKGNLVYLPDFPNPQNAKYDEWKLFFDAWISQIQIEGELVLIGTSLGGCFLLKYFSDISVIARHDPSSAEIPLRRMEAIQISENNTEHGLLRTSRGRIVNISAIHFLAACIEAGDFTTPTNYETLKSLKNKVHIWHAEDDPVVPFATAQELQELLPEAQTHFFRSEKGYGHFYGLERIPELEILLLQK